MNTNTNTNTITEEAESTIVTLEEAKKILDGAKKREAEAKAEAEAKKLREEANAKAEAEAKKTLRESLIRLLVSDGDAFIKSLQFTDGAKNRKRVKPFTKPYTAKTEDGEAVTLLASVRFGIFNRYDNVEADTSEARKMKTAQRKAVSEALHRVALLASEAPNKEDAKTALEAIREAVRLSGFGEYGEALNASDAKKILASSYRLSDSGEDDSEDREVKNAIQARLYRIVCGREEANAKTLREEAKKREAEAKKREAEEAKKTLEEAKAEAKRILEEAKTEAKKTLEEAKPKTAKKTAKK